MKSTHGNRGGRKPHPDPMPDCRISVCDRPSISRNGLGLCKGHKTRYYRGDSIEDMEAAGPLLWKRKERRREYHRTPGGTSRLIVVDVETGARDVVLYDDADHDLIVGYNWYVARDPRYPTATPPGQRREVRMHRVLMGLKPGDKVEVDHWSGDTLDNRRSNLRLADRVTNGGNLARVNNRGSSRFRNVHWNSRRRKWVVEMKIGPKIVFPPDGVFDDELAAARFAWQYRADHGLEPGYWPTDDTTTEEEEAW